MIRLQFNSPETRDAFADRFKLDSKVGENQLDINWNLLQFAKVDNNCIDYDDLDAANNVQHEFIVKGDPAKFLHISGTTVKQDLGKGFYLVSSSEGTLLGDFVDSIEHTSAPVTYLATDCYIDEMNLEPSTENPAESSDAQWARLRVISRYRPLATTFSTHELKYLSKPELIIMDSGINFDHPEFDYPGFEYEDFYSLPSLNGAFRDDVGHGTAVASCAVGKNLGVSFNQKVVNVKIGGAGHTATVYEIGMCIDAILERVLDNPTVTRVVNMSWGVARSAWLDSKVESLLDAGITVVCAAGNQGISVEDISPAGINDVITVAAVDRYDIPAGFNNISPSDAGVTTGHGMSLDLFAPGENLVVASHNTKGYHIGSGTSFAAPYVSGVAVAMASVYKDLVPYSTLKSLLVDNSTPDAILFEDNKFSDNQNKLIYYPLSDPNTNQKTNNLLSYLGFLSESVQKIEFNLTSTLPVKDLNKILNEMPKLTIKFKDPTLGEKYAPYVVISPDTIGMITITYPRFDMPEEVKLQMVEFSVLAEFSNITMESPTLFFYDTNYNHKTTIQGDVTLALTETNSVSYYGSWGSCK